MFHSGFSARIVAGAAIVLSLLLFSTVAADSTDVSDSLSHASAAFAGQADTTAAASAGSEAPIAELDRMVVTASKRSMSADMIVEDVEVVTAEDGRMTGAFTMMEMLDGIPGIDIDPARTQTNIVLNGMKGEYVKILVDGIPVTGNVGGGFPLENLAMGDISRVEVLSGAASTVYGTDAIGGVVNIITDQVTSPTPLRLRASYNYLTNDSIAEWGGKNRLDLSVLHCNRVMRAEGYYGFDLDNGIGRTFTDDYGTYTTYSYPDADAQKGGLKLAFFPSATLTLKPGVTYAVSSTERSSGTELLFLRNESATINLSAGYDPTEHFGLHGYGSIRSFNHLHRNITQIISPRTDDSRTEFLDFEGELRCGFNDMIRFGGTNHIMAGLNVLRERIESDNLRQGVSRLQGGLFAAASWESGTSVNLIVNPSLRVTVAETERAGGSEAALADISPKIGLRLNNPVVSGTHIKLSYGQAYKAPRLKKMYYSFNMGDAMWIEGNEDLSPEKSHQVDLGLGYALRRLLNVSLSGYYTKLTNMIVLRSVSNPDGSQAYRGLNGEPQSSLDDDERRLPEKTYENSLWGYTYGVTAKARLSPFPWLSLSVAATHIYSAAEDDEGRMLELEHYSPNTMHLRTGVDLEQVRPYLPHVNITAIWKGAQIDSYVGGTQVYEKPYTKLNVHLKKSILHGLSLRLGVNNILNYVRDGHAGLNYGRTYTAGLDMDIKDLSEPGVSLEPTLF